MTDQLLKACRWNPKNPREVYWRETCPPQQADENKRETLLRGTSQNQRRNLLVLLGIMGLYFKVVCLPMSEPQTSFINLIFEL